jgi:hypothetical protein
MEFTKQKIGPINLVSILIFFFHLAAMIFCYSYFKNKWNLQNSQQLWFDLENSIHIVLLYLPLAATTFLNFISSFVDRSGIVNGKCCLYALLTGLVYTMSAYFIEWDAQSIFFGPAMMLLPAFYGLIFITCFFIFWLLPEPRRR